VRLCLILLSAALFAQTPPPAKPAAAPRSPAAKPAAAKPSAAKPAAAKPAAAKPAPVPELTTDDQKTIYALGLVISRQLGQFQLTPEELDIVKRALGDAQAGNPAVKIEEWGPKIQALSQARAAKIAEAEKAASKVYIEKAAAEPGAVKTASGVIYKELSPGTGPHPQATDTVKVNYRGTLINGTEFDSSYKRNEPAQFALNQVVRCWTEGVQKMSVGGKGRLICPSEMAYGDQGRPGIPGGAALVFEIELLEIVNSGAGK
jgi:FKBP-type peptidyl-prolyl cis-trans isomerase FkpA